MSARNHALLVNLTTDTKGIINLVERHSLRIEQGYKTPEEEATAAVRVLVLLEQAVSEIAALMKDQLKESKP